MQSLEHLTILKTSFSSVDYPPYYAQAVLE